MPWFIEQEVELTKGAIAGEKRINIMPLAYPGSANAHQWRVKVKYNNVSFDLTGYAATAYFQTPDGRKVVQHDSTIIDNSVSVLIPSEVYAESGMVKAVLFLEHSGSTVIPISGITFNVLPNLTGEIIDPGSVLPTSVEALVAEIGDMREATAEARAVVSSSVRYDAAQTLTDAQKGTARGNIDAANVSAFETLKDTVDTNRATPAAVNAEKLRAQAEEARIEALFTAPTQTAVNRWLDEHPEAVTTVEDHSLTYDKFVLGALGYVTPEMYGAKGDGRTDDTAALQDCIAENDIVCMIGTYLISGEISLHNNLRIYGFGKGTIIKNDEVENQYAALCYYYDYDTVSSLLENVTIDGLTIVGVQHWTGRTVSGRDNDCGIRIRNIAPVESEEEEPQLQHNRDLVSHNITISNNHVYECGACAIDVNGIDCRIINNTVIYTGAFYETFNINQPPNYNFAINYTGNGFLISGNTIRGVIQGLASGLTNKNVVISGNNISTNGQHGLYIEGATNVVVTGNTIHDCLIVGIKFQRYDDDLNDFRNVSITGNVIQNCGLQGILFANMSTADIPTENITISGNNIINTVRGVEIIDSTEINITGNNIIGGGSMNFGVITRNVSRALIAGNHFKNTLTGSSSGAVSVIANMPETGKLSVNEDICIRGNTFYETVGVRINGDVCVRNLDIDGNVFIDGLTTSDIKFATGDITCGATIRNNVVETGCAVQEGVSNYRAVSGNVNMSNKNTLPFAVDADASTRLTLTSQDCYVYGDSVYINISYTLNERGSNKKSLVVPATALLLRKNVNYEYLVPNTSDMYLTFVYTGEELRMYTRGGIAGTDYTFSVTI